MPLATIYKIYKEWEFSFDIWLENVSQGWSTIFGVSTVQRYINREWGQPGERIPAIGIYPGSRFICLSYALNSLGNVYPVTGANPTTGFDIPIKTRWSHVKVSQYWHSTTAQYRLNMEIDGRKNLIDVANPHAAIWSAATIRSYYSHARVRNVLYTTHPGDVPFVHTVQK